jgi:predicted small lipoprotein YifL
MLFLKKILLGIVTLSMVASLAACDREGPMERAGEKVDKGVENTKDAVKDATN